MSFELLGTINKIRRKSNRGYDALSPIYELLLNAINAERNNAEVDKDVIINIEYSTTMLNETDKKERVGYIKISDFGVGFNNAQFESFKNLNSTTNQKLGCRGMGRFQIMRSFHKIKIESFNGDERFWFDLAESNISDNNVEGFSDKNRIINNVSVPSSSKETIVECFYDISIRNNKFDEAVPIKAIDEEEIKDRINAKLLLKLALLKRMDLILI